MDRGKLTYILLIGIILISIILAIVAYPKLPAKIASHWNQKGIVDDYMPKAVGVFLVPFILIILFLFYLVIPKVDSLKKNIIKFKLQFDNFIVLLFLFMLYILVLLILYNLGVIFNFSKFMIPAFAVIVYSAGILIKKSKRNWFIGIKTPWTLHNDMVWNKTHRLASILFKVSGIIIFIGLFLYEYAYSFFFLTIILATIVPIIYSYVLYYKIENK